MYGMFRNDKFVEYIRKKVYSEPSLMKSYSDFENHLTRMRLYL